MIEDKDIDNAIEAGRIASSALMMARRLVKKDRLLLDIARTTEEYIISKGGKPAFPMQMSINENAAHDTVSYDDKRILNGDEVVKIDVGCHVSGIIADNALTVDLGGEHRKLLESSLNALEYAVYNVKKGITITELSKGISSSITTKGFVPVSNLSGHGLGKYKIHSDPQIPNIPVSSDYKIRQYEHIAIEPFSTDGYGKVIDSKTVQVYALSRNTNVRDMIARQALSIIRGYNGLPFSMRWLSEKIGRQRAEHAVTVLLSNNIISSYPVLREVQGGIVAQHERTFIVLEDETIVTTKWSLE
ncbi:MAG: type II methionyl aminopeptidase [Candidatus Woesearchaeota archaeon]